MTGLKLVCQKVIRHNKRKGTRIHQKSPSLKSSSTSAISIEEDTEVDNENFITLPIKKTKKFSTTRGTTSPRKIVHKKHWPPIWLWLRWRKHQNYHQNFTSTTNYNIRTRYQTWHNQTIKKQVKIFILNVLNLIQTFPTPWDGPWPTLTSIERQTEKTYAYVIKLKDELTAKNRKAWCSSCTHPTTTDFPGSHKITHHSQHSYHIRVQQSKKLLHILGPW